MWLASATCFGCMRRSATLTVCQHSVLYWLAIANFDNETVAAPAAATVTCKCQLSLSRGMAWVSVDGPAAPRVALRQAAGSAGWQCPDGCACAGCGGSWRCPVPRGKPAPIILYYNLWQESARIARHAECSPTKATSFAYCSPLQRCDARQPLTLNRPADAEWGWAVGGGGRPPGASRVRRRRRRAEPVNSPPQIV